MTEGTLRYSSVVRDYRDAPAGCDCCNAIEHRALCKIMNAVMSLRCPTHTQRVK